MKKNILIFISLVLIFVPFYNSFGQNTNCIFDSKIKELQDFLNNQNLDYLTRYNKELSLRKEILSNIFECLILESKNYIDVLNKLNIVKPAVGEMRNKLINELNKSIDYYKFRKDQIQSLSLDGLKYTAKSLKEDRESKFIPLNKIINNFILWNKNEELFNLAQNRVIEIEKIINILKSKNNQEIENLFNDIVQKLKISLNKHNNAYNAIDSFDYDKASNLIQESLSDLLDVYKLIYDLSKKTFILAGVK
ncbi:MAG: hypothetical protein NZ484_01885 [Patescibacteria group bacterium]|nr:hypothetical protein [Patescibacteria group bacterium]MCX7589650.1 hypothetical protein [Patescibacteria group bacterium]MDW8279622.1 hypothetical protein [bacterium]